MIDCGNSDSSKSCGIGGSSGRLRMIQGTVKTLVVDCGIGDMGSSEGGSIGGTSGIL